MAGTVMELLAWFVFFLVALALVVGRFLFGADARHYTPRRVAERLWATIRANPGPLAVAALVAVVHHLAVNVWDPLAAAWVRSVTGLEFTRLVLAVEGDLVARMAAVQWPPLTVAVVYFYLVFHSFFILFTPVYIALTHEGRLVRTALLIYPAVYFLALPFLLFFPSTNPYVYFGFPSPLEAVIPGVEALFYRSTTVDNTLPSLHVALAVALAMVAHHSGNPRFRALGMVYAPLVVASVLYLRIHWIVDVLGGLAVGYLGFRLAYRAADAEALSRWRLPRLRRDASRGPRQDY